MFKNVIAPIQAWLMSQGKCVGCGMPLDKGSKKRINMEKWSHVNVAEYI